MQRVSRARHLLSDEPGKTFDEMPQYLRFATMFLLREKVFVQVDDRLYCHWNQPKHGAKT